MGQGQSLLRLHQSVFCIEEILELLKEREMNKTFPTLGSSPPPFVTRYWTNVCLGPSSGRSDGRY